MSNQAWCRRASVQVSISLVTPSARYSKRDDLYGSKISWRGPLTKQLTTLDVCCPFLPFYVLLVYVHTLRRGVRLFGEPLLQASSHPEPMSSSSCSLLASHGTRLTSSLQALHTSTPLLCPNQEADRLKSRILLACSVDHIGAPTQDSNVLLPSVLSVRSKRTNKTLVGGRRSPNFCLMSSRSSQAFGTHLRCQ